MDGEGEVDSDFGKMNISLHRPEPELSRAASANSLDWDNYASDPTYSQENERNPSLNISECELRQSFRDRVKDHLASEKGKQKVYNLRSRHLSSFSFDSDQDLGDRLAQHSRDIHPDFDVNDLALSSSNASEVFELGEPEPPPLPPRAHRSTSVMVCNRFTCKPKKK